MSRICKPVLALSLLAVVAAGCARKSPETTEENIQLTEPPAVAAVTLTSSAFTEGGNIPQKYTCEGDNVSPPLAVSGMPDNAQSLALIVDDPDAPNGTFVHWVVWDLPVTGEIGEGKLSEGAKTGMTSANKTGYTGPCPPVGSHRYYFKLYALDAEPQVAENATKTDLEAAMQGHIVGQGQLMGRYEKKK